MAGSRLTSIGTIFTRCSGLLETGAVKDKPIWYDVYKKYPPFEEPDTGREMPPQDPVPEIVYEEDFQRAKQASTVVNMLPPPKKQAKFKPFELDPKEKIDKIIETLVRN